MAADNALVGNAANDSAGVREWGGAVMPIGRPPVADACRRRWVALWSGWVEDGPVGAPDRYGVSVEFQGPAVVVDAVVVVPA